MLPEGFLATAVALLGWLLSFAMVEEKALVRENAHLWPSALLCCCCDSSGMRG